MTRRLRWVLWALGLAVAAPIIVTLIGAATSPPHARGVPVGHLIYLDADQPSEKTTTLRGLYLSQSDGPPRLLVHEDEPQDTDAGVREWITQPTASSDGTQAAYIKQNITLLEETHTQDTQIWVMPLNVPGAKPRLLLDLTKFGGVKQPVGLTWTPDSHAVVFLNDTTLFQVAATGRPAVTRHPLKDVPALKRTADISATGDPAFNATGGVNFRAETPGGSMIVAGGKAYPINTLAFTYNGREFALAMSGKETRAICRSPTPTWSDETAQAVRWGWSLFGRRHITSLHWSPDGRYVGFTVSKPPIPEDELFYLDTTDGKTYQLPVRTGRAAWDWTR